MFDKGCGPALDAVSACFVGIFAGIQIPPDFHAIQCAKLHFARRQQALQASVSLDRHRGVHPVMAASQTRQHGLGGGAIKRFTEYLAVHFDQGVRTQYGKFEQTPDFDCTPAAGSFFARHALDEFHR